MKYSKIFVAYLFVKETNNNTYSNKYFDRTVHVSCKIGSGFNQTNEI